MGIELGVVLFMDAPQKQASIHESGCSIVGRKGQKFGEMQ
jgi:hypothetical protein